MHKENRFFGPLATVFLLLVASTCFGESPFRVKDPNASFFDVQSRRQSLQRTQTPRLREALGAMRRCADASPPLPPSPRQNIPSRYLNGSHGALNPEEHKLSEPYYHVQDVAAWGADRYLATGDPNEAACVIRILLPWANSKALLGYSARDEMVVWFQSTWTVASLALSVSVIRAEPTLNQAERDRVIRWLHEAAWKAVDETRGPNSGTERNNHLFWRGLAATATGVISGDDKLFTKGLKIYATALAEIDARGAFPEEMARHELALHYQAFAIEPLVMIAELADRQKLDMYSLEENGHCLRDAVTFLAKAMAQPSLVKTYTPETQQIDPDLQPGSQLLAWVEIWNARTHDASWQKFVTKPYYAARLGGSTTLFAAEP